MQLILSVSREHTRMSVGRMDQLGEAGAAATRIRKRILKGTYNSLMVTSRHPHYDVYGDLL